MDKDIVYTITWGIVLLTTVICTTIYRIKALKHPDSKVIESNPLPINLQLKVESKDSEIKELKKL